MATTPPNPAGEAIDFALPVPSSPVSSSSPSSSGAGSEGTAAAAPKLPALRAPNDAAMTPSSTPLGMLNHARRPPASVSNLATARAGGLPSDIQARMKAFQQSRQGAPPVRPAGRHAVTTGPAPTAAQGVGGVPAGFRLPADMRPQPSNFQSAPAVPKVGGGLSARRGMKLPGGLPGGLSDAPGSSPNLNGSADPAPVNGGNSGSMFNKFSNYVDTKEGTLKFAGKAIIHGNGVEFSSGNKFAISLDEVDTLEELGKGNYGTVYKVRHARPRMRIPGLGLGGNKTARPSETPLPDGETAEPETTGAIMAMKEIRLELDEVKFAAIIMELDILHRCLSPYIIDFYGAFFQEGAVYICIEFMDAGSIDKIYGDGIPENVLRKITHATAQGLKTLKDDHNIIHRDVKPTNILVNTRGQVKICDFGVSGNLVASIAKTNIGCQSYMAPERISGGGMSQAGANPGGGTYSVQSDIWSLGLTIIECAMGQYPYPPETYTNIFSQLSAIVDGDPPDLPSEGYSALARDFVRGCLHKIPNLRPTYSMLLQHGWLADLSQPSTIQEEDEELEEAMDGLGVSDGAASKAPTPISHGTEDAEVAAWVVTAMERKRLGLMGVPLKPALHAAPLDSSVS